MDVDLVGLTKTNFHSRLGRLLEHVCIADFVAIDFELSGIATKFHAAANDATKKDSRQTGKPTVQQRYEEMKGVAEKYQILQVGLTLGAQSEGAGGYFLEPYNINLNPCIDYLKDFDREFSMLGSSMKFLVENGFQIDRPFVEGVPYLSREEQDRAVQMESERLSGKSFREVDLAQEESGYRDWVGKVRQRLKYWKPKNKDDSMMITGSSGAVGLPMSKFQRLLIYDLVRNEFSTEFAATAHNGCIKVIPLDPDREEKHKKVKMEAFMEKISKQVGFRWVMESLVGGSLEDLNPVDLYMTPETIWLDMDKIRAETASLRKDLKARRPVLVGHNMFMDLIFMYKAFYGPLPDKVTDFAKAVHELFPMIIDTKFLCTHTGNSDNSSLQELTQNLDEQKKPEIWTRPGHKRYEKATTFHEAGYDSWQTAQLLIKTSARLAARANWKHAVKKATIRGTSRPLTPGTPSPKPPPKPVEVDLIDFDEDPTYGPSLFDQAKQARECFGTDAIADGSKPAPAGILPLEQFHLLPKPVEPEEADPHNMPDPSKDSEFVPKWMPAWDSDFWLLFGNKIRINGTQESLLDLLAKDERVKVEP